MASVAEEVLAAAQPPDLVELGRGSLDPTRGFVVGASEKLVLVHNLSDRVDLDGYSAVRLIDITWVDRELNRKAFYLKALELKALQAVTPAGIDLTDMPSLMRFAEARYPLLVIHREKVVPNECEVGRLKLSTSDFYALRFISPGATWQDDDRKLRYSDVTRVQFDGEYENTLALVAGGAG